MKSAPKDYRPGNLEAARIILETPEVYGAGMVEWARRVRGEWSEKPKVEEISCNRVSDLIMS